MGAVKGRAKLATLTNPFFKSLSIYGKLTLIFKVRYHISSLRTQGAIFRAIMVMGGPKSLNLIIHIITLTGYVSLFSTKTMIVVEC